MLLLYFTFVSVGLGWFIISYLDNHTSWQLFTGLIIQVIVVVPGYYVFRMMGVGYLVTIRDRQKLQLMVDASFGRPIFTNVVPNIFRTVGIPVSNLLPTGTSRKLYAFK